MKPTLFILAAGMGSRYGGLKQLDGLGPGGETIMDYSIYDALRSGFGKVVFIIRHDFEAFFREKILSKYTDHIPVAVVFQDLNDLPAGFRYPEGRTKPWGTNHAVMMGARVIREPFAVINADDFYGRDSFSLLGRALSAYRPEDGPGHYCMISYKVGNTLSASGTVARGICSSDAEGYLSSVVERVAVERIDGRVCYVDTDGRRICLDENTPVSMNMWGFTPDYFKYSEEYFVRFLEENIRNPKSEFFIPQVVNNLIEKGLARVKVMQTDSEWFGVTYAADRQGVVDKLKALVDAGVYPPKLF